MTFEIGFVLAVLITALVLFVKEWFPPDGVALGILVALVIGGVLTPKEAFGAFGNEALITVAAMFVVAAGLIRTGAVGFIGQKILKIGGGSEVRVMLALMVTAACCSAFINNTPIVVIFLPIALSLADATGVAPSKLLLPLAYSTIAGGMCSLIGTSTNLLVSNSLPQYNLEPLHFFEPLPLALIGTVATMLFLATIGRKLLPSRTSMTTAIRGGRIVEYVTEFEVTANSSLIGRDLAALLAEHGPDVRALQLIRGEEILDPAGGPLSLRAGDVLIVEGSINALHGLRRASGLVLAKELAAPGFEVRGKDLTLAELLVRPPSSAVGERVRDLNLYSRHGVAVLAVQRHGTHIREKVADLRLRVGDILLVQAEAPALQALHEARNFMLIEGVAERLTVPHRARLALGIVLSVIVLATVDLPFLPISVLAVAGAVGMVAGGCLTPRDGYRAVDVPILALIGGTICLGLGLEKSGAARWIAGGLTEFTAPFGQVALLSAIYLITNVLTALISNNGSALLMLPIAIETARAAGLDPTPFLLAVMFAASIDYSTPIGYQVNTIVYGPGGYRFSDYVKVGVPLNLMWWLLATLLIPVFWPLRPA